MYKKNKPINRDGATCRYRNVRIGKLQEFHGWYLYKVKYNIRHIELGR